MERETSGRERVTYPAGLSNGMTDQGVVEVSKGQNLLRDTKKWRAMILYVLNRHGT